MVKPSPANLEALGRQWSASWNDAKAAKKSKKARPEKGQEGPSVEDKPEEAAAEEEDEEEEGEGGWVGEEEEEPEERPGAVAKARREKRKRDVLEEVVDIPTWDDLVGPLRPSPKLQGGIIMLEKEFRLAFADLHPYLEGIGDGAVANAMAREIREIFQKYIEN